MGNRKNTFLLKRSSVSGKVPTNSDLVEGELGLNTSDSKLYTKDVNNNVLQIGWDRVNKSGDTMTGDLTLPSLTATNNVIADKLFGDGSNITNLYGYDLIWAEENAGISANQDEYSYGNGAVGTIGIPCYIDGTKAVGMILDADTAGNSATVGLKLNGSLVAGEYEITGTQEVNVHYFTNHLDIPLGNRIGFRTTSVSGTWTDVRVGLIIAIPLTSF